MILTHLPLITLKDFVSGKLGLFGMVSTTLNMKVNGSGQIQMLDAKDTLSGRKESQMVKEERIVLSSTRMETGMTSAVMESSHLSVNLVPELQGSVKLNGQVSSCTAY